jgi:hypothetical protein
VRPGEEVQPLERGLRSLCRGDDHDGDYYCYLLERFLPNLAAVYAMRCHTIAPATNTPAATYKHSCMRSIRRVGCLAFMSRASSDFVFFRDDNNQAFLSQSNETIMVRRSVSLSVYVIPFAALQQNRLLWGARFPRLRALGP